MYQSFDWKHGTFVGSIMASETTAAATGAVGVVRRDPMAMLPFCGYNMGEYFAHWLKMGETTPNLPKIFHVNWFRLTDEGKFMWPGFGDNFRVLEWIIKRCEDKVGAKETEIGYVPYADDINLEELDYEIEPGRKFTKADLESILTVEKDYWLDDFNSVKEFYAKIGDTIPAELTKQLNDEIARLFSNTLRWDVGYLSDQGPRLDGEDGFARKVKPFWRLTEFETATYAFLEEIEHHHTPCPYSAGASFTYYKGLWNQLEEEMPGRKLSFYVDFLKRGRSAFAGLERTEGDALAPCTVCGYPTSSGVCGVCRIREVVKEGKE